jgi:GNAT superfamily N-acetyltransferase
MNEELNTIIRNYETTDFPFVINSWLNSSHELFPARKVNKKYYNKINTPIIASLISGISIAVASNPDDKNHIFGYLAYEQLQDEFIIFWIYVKRELRNFGIGKKLIETCIPQFGKKKIVITSLPNIKEQNQNIDIINKYNLIFDPYFINRKVNI